MILSSKLDVNEVVAARLARGPRIRTNSINSTYLPAYLCVVSLSFSFGRSFALFFPSLPIWLHPTPKAEVERKSRSRIELSPARGRAAKVIKFNRCRHASPLTQE